MTVVLVHGLGSDRRQPLDLLGPVIASSDPPGEPVIGLDVHAHGDQPASRASAVYRLDALANDLVARVRAAAPPGALDRPVTLAGISMGAAIILRIALQELLPVERALFIRPAFTSVSLPPNLRAFPVIGELLRAHPPRVAERRFRETDAYRHISLESPAGARGLISQFRSTGAGPRAVRLVEIPRNRAYRDLAEPEALAVSSLVIGAERDPVHPFTVAEEWAGAFGAPLERIPPRDDGQAAQTAALRQIAARFLRQRTA
jgi:pimeloyl-ACP methyl ester carboxylesterase